jgi:tetratricopeptide (TPR) repeat protein
MDELMPDILLKRIMLWKIRKYSDISKEEMDQVTDQLHLHLKHIGQLSGVYHFQFQYDSVFTSRGAISDREDLIEFGKLLRSIEDSGIGESASFPVQASYLLLLHSMYMFSDQADRAYQANLKLLEMFDKNPSQIAHRRNQYHHTLARIVESQAGLHYFTDASQNLQKLRDSSLAHATNTDAYFWSYYILLLSIMLSREMHDFKTLLKLMEDNQAMIYPKVIDNRNGDIQLKMHAAQIYFYWGKYDTVLNLLNDVLNNPRNGVRTDFYCYAKVLLLITYWEMGNLSIMPYELKSTRHFFESRLALIDSDRIILRFIEKNLQKEVNSRSLVEPFRQFKRDLESCFIDKFNKRPTEYIDVTLWAESKIQRLPMTEIERESK